MNLVDEIAALARRTVPELRERYAALFGEGTTAKHKTWLVKRIAWRLQAVAEKLCGGSLTPLLTNLVRSKRLTPRERREIRKLMDELDH